MADIGTAEAGVGTVTKPAPPVKRDHRSMTPFERGSAADLRRALRDLGREKPPVARERAIKLDTPPPKHVEHVSPATAEELSSAAEERLRREKEREAREREAATRQLQDAIGQMRHMQEMAGEKAPTSKKAEVLTSKKAEVLTSKKAGRPGHTAPGHTSPRSSPAQRIMGRLKSFGARVRL